MTMRRPDLTGLPARSRVLAATRWLYRRDGLSPSHSEIADIAAVSQKRVSALVRSLSQEGVLTHRHGQRRSIALVERATMLSDDELRCEAVARGWQIGD